MKTAKVIALLGFIFMSIAILNGFINGSFTQDGGELLRNPWGVVSLTDLFVGFALFLLWIFFREESLIIKLLWIPIMAVLGFLAAALYIFIQLVKSDGDWLKFFLGSKKDQLIQKEIQKKNTQLKQ